jgi:hypothetical protein
MFRRVATAEAPGIIARRLAPSESTMNPAVASLVILDILFFAGGSLPARAKIAQSHSVEFRHFNSLITNGFSRQLSTHLQSFLDRKTRAWRGGGYPVFKVARCLRRRMERESREALFQAPANLRSMACAKLASAADRGDEAVKALHNG